MGNLKKFYNNVIKHSLLNKFNYKKITKLPKIDKITLNLDCKQYDSKRIASSLLALELITTKRGQINNAKKSSTILKIRKGNPIGCKVCLTKKLNYIFIIKLLSEVLPKIKNMNDFGIKCNSKNYNSASYTLKNNLIFFEFEDNYYLFNKLPCLQITISTNSKTKEELMFLLKSLKINAY